MRALWLNKFDCSGKTEAFIELAEGVLKKGLKVHLVLNGVPPSLTGTYREYMNKKALKSSINISTQQIQNLLYYRSCELLHVYHPALFPLAQNLSSSLQIRWAATCLQSIDHTACSTLAGAAFITCSSRPLWSEINSYLHPYKKEKLLLIPPGIKISPPEFSPPEKLRFLYIGPLESNHLAFFLKFNRLIENFEGCTFGVISEKKLPGVKGTFYSWTPDWDDIARKYDIVISSGFSLLRGIAKGKIALLMEEKYGGIFSPREQVQVPDFRAIPGTGDTDADEELLKRDLQALGELLKKPSAAKRLQQENWDYARENHDLAIVSEQLLRLYSRTL